MQIAVAAALLAFLTGPAWAETSVDVCELIAQPERFADKQITVRGYISTDYREFSGITGAKCSAKFIATRSSHEPIGDAELASALEKVRRTDRHVYVLAVARVSSTPNEVPSIRLVVSKYRVIGIR
jgi:hypothetical protein